MKDIKVLGIDLAKNVFQLHGTNVSGKVMLRKKLSRAKLIEFMSNLSSCLVGMEACGGAHYWARTFKAMGHEVKMMAPQFVKPYIKSSKNDENDAEGINEAVTRPSMRFVPIKTIEQQDILLLHRAKEMVTKQRTAQSNHIRGLLAEYGIIVPQGMYHLKNLPSILERGVAENNISDQAKEVFLRLYEQLKRYQEEVDYYDKKIKIHAEEDARCIEVQKIDGIGPITASAIVATIGDPDVFKNGREVAAWLGLVPSQRSSGNKIILGPITKRGDRYVRMLLVHGGRAAVKTCEKKTDKRNLWLADKKHRLGFNKAAVALANKNARTVWALLKTGECYRQPAQMNGN